MWKCRVDEVLALVVALVAQCVEGVQCNRACYLCGDFLANHCEAQDLSKTFHYAWVLLSIMLVA